MSHTFPICAAYLWHLSHMYKHTSDTCHTCTSMHVTHVTSMYKHIRDICHLYVHAYRPTWHMCKPICGTCHICTSIQVTPVTCVQADMWHMSLLCTSIYVTYVQADMWRMSHMSRHICGMCHLHMYKNICDTFGIFPGLARHVSI